MLDLTGDTAGDVELGMNRNTRLANLTVVVGKAGVDGGTAGTYLGVEFLGQFEQHVEAFLRAHTVTSGHYDGGALQVVFGLLHVTVDDLHYIVRFGHVLGHVVTDYFALIVGVEDFFLHHTFADGGHLRTVFGIDDGGYDVTAESGTDLIEKLVVSLAELLVLVATDFQLSTVGGQSAGQGRRYTRSEVAADDGGTHQADLRLLFLEQVDKDGSVGQGSIGEEARGIEHVYAVYAERQHLFFYTFEAGAGADGFQLAAQFVG